MVALDRAKLLDDAIVLYASDNGGCYRSGGLNGPYRGTKHSLFEGKRGTSHRQGAREDTDGCLPILLAQGRGASTGMHSSSTTAFPLPPAPSPLQLPLLLLLPLLTLLPLCSSSLAGGVRAPAFLWSRRLARELRGREYPHPFHVTDVLPTLLAAVGHDLRPDRTCVEATRAGEPAAGARSHAWMDACVLTSGCHGGPARCVWGG